MTKPKIIIGTKIIWEQSEQRRLSPESHWVYSGGVQVLKPFRYKFIQFETGLYLWSKAYVFAYPNYQLFRYLNVPLNCRLTTKYFYFSAGPDLNYLISLNKDHGTKYYPIKKSDINSFAIGANANTGFQFTFHRVKTFFEVRYAWTLSSFEKSAGFIAQMSFLNIGAAIGLNYSFGHQPKR